MDFDLTAPFWSLSIDGVHIDFTSLDAAQKCANRPHHTGRARTILHVREDATGARSILGQQYYAAGSDKPHASLGDMGGIHE